jgi:hypothetical protein
MQKRASRAVSLKKRFFNEIVTQITNATNEELCALVKSEAETDSDSETRVMSVLAADEIAKRERYMSGLW